MRPKSRVPLSTKIYLAILVYLAALLLLLVLLRAADRPLNWGAVQALLPGNGTDEAVETTLTAQPPPAAEPTFPAEGIWLRAMANVGIYDSLGEANQPVAILESGQIAPVIGVSADRQWWAIRVPYLADGQGWVTASQVTVQNAEQAPTVGVEGPAGNQPRPTGQMAIALAVANVNVRRGPDMSFEKIGLLKNGEEAEIIGVSPDRLWWAIRLPGDAERTGWVAKDYIVARNSDGVPVLTPESSTPGGSVSSPQPGRPFLVAAWTVNIRAGPGKQYAIVGTLQQGQMAEIIGVSEDASWWAIKFESAEGERGWVAAAYVQAENTQNVPVLK